jgi:CDP-diacylglycerol--glycerol-3-phosphate 3-phosphatidyltransferase
MDEVAVTNAGPPASLSRDVWNVPNQITIARLVLATVCFAALAGGWYLTSLVLFVLAAGTDWLDGYWARRFNQVTQLGRILDPFADKFIICGVFIFLAAESQSGIAAWMTVVVVARELLVTGLRSFMEQQGIDFSASWSGKWKMVLQCLAAGLSMFRLTYLDAGSDEWATTPPDWLNVGLVAAVWAAVLLTIYSGWIYIRRAMKALSS